MKKTMKSVLAILLVLSCLSCTGPVVPPETEGDTEIGRETDPATDSETDPETETEPVEETDSDFLNGIGDITVDIKRDGPAEVDWSAKWIWDTDNKAPHNWLCMRKTVDLGSVPERAVTRISIDSRYWLWINGELVVYEGSAKRGPTAEDTYFDTIDIAPYLKKGENTIALLGWYFGNESDYYSHKSSGAAALLFQAQIGDLTLISDSSWKVQKHSAYLLSTPETDPGSQPSYRLPEGNILYDARLAQTLEGWYLPEYDDSTWENATEYGVAGDAPWNALWQRSIPLMAWSEILPYENPEAYAPYTEAATTETVRIGMKLPYNLQLQPYLKVEAEAGIKIQMLSDGWEALRASYITTDGVQEFESYSWVSAQTLTYEIPAGVKVLELGYRRTGYDTEFSGSFTSDDEALNQLWEESLYTLYITMRDTYMDCPDRERAQWWGDVTNESIMAFYSLDESSYYLYRKGVDTLLGWRGDDSWSSGRTLMTVVPMNNGVLELPMQQLAGIVGFWTYYQYTGDTEFLRQVYEPSAEYLRTWGMMGKDNLIPHKSGTWDWMDWGDGTDIRVIENAWYYWACDSVLKMGEVLGDESYKSNFSRRIKKLQEGYETFWNEELGAYMNETSDGTPDDRGNALAVLSGLAPVERYEQLLPLLVNTHKSSPYMEMYVQQAMLKMGAEEEALSRMKDRYNVMLTDSWTTLYEYFTAPGTHNHAWAGAPMVALSAYVAGIAPDTAGYEAYHVIPQLAYLNQVSCTVPSVKGDIVLDLTRTEDGGVTMTLTSPADTVARVGVPCDAASTVSCNGVAVYENGVGTDAVKGVQFLSADEEYVYFSVQPGTWTLTSAQ